MYIRPELETQWSFLPRDAYASRGLCRRKTSVCPSVTRWYSVDTAEHILKIFLPSNSPTILV